MFPYPIQQSFLFVIKFLPLIKKLSTFSYFPKLRGRPPFFVQKNSAIAILPCLRLITVSFIHYIRVEQTESLV